MNNIRTEINTVKEWKNDVNQDSSQDVGIPSGNLTHCTKTSGKISDCQVEYKGFKNVQQKGIGMKNSG